MVSDRKENAKKGKTSVKSADDKNRRESVSVAERSKKGFISRLFENADKKLEEKSKSCCCCCCESSKRSSDKPKKKCC